MTADISAECTIEQLPRPTSRRTTLFMRRSDLGVALLHLHCGSIVHFHRRRLYSHHLKGTSLGQLSHEVLRSEEHTSELQSLMRISYAVYCLKKKKKIQHYNTSTTTQNNTHR